MNCVAPGPVWTPLVVASFSKSMIATFGAQFPIGRPAQPAELATSYVFLASQESRYVNAEVAERDGWHAYLLTLCGVGVEECGGGAEGVVWKQGSENWIMLAVSVGRRRARRDWSTVDVHETYTAWCWIKDLHRSQHSGPAAMQHVDASPQCAGRASDQRASSHTTFLWRGWLKREG